MAAIQDLDSALSYALQRLGCEAMILKPQQWKFVKCMYEGKDVFLWLPTGFGKSICYEVSPFVFDVKLARMDSVVIVVTNDRPNSEPEEQGGESCDHVFDGRCRERPPRNRR